MRSALDTVRAVKGGVEGIKVSWGHRPHTPFFGVLSGLDTVLGVNRGFVAPRVRSAPIGPVSTAVMEHHARKLTRDDGEGLRVATVC